MKKIGIIGGLGPESTTTYYSEIISAFKPSYNKTGFPSIVIESLDLKEFFGMADQNQWPNIADIIAKACNNLEHAGANFGAIASNTPHKVFDIIAAKTSLPLISIVEETFKIVKTKKLDRLVLLGTKFTMSSGFYQNIFSKNSIELVTPNNFEQNYIQTKLFTEIEFGVIKKKTKQDFLSIINRLEEEENTQGVILGCTELPLIIEPSDVQQEYIDTTQIHINAIVAKCLE